MKKLLVFILAMVMVFSFAGCGGKKEEAPAKQAKQSEVQKIIQQAQGMTFDQLAKKAIEESKGKKFYGLGNSSRGKSALPLFINHLKKIDPSYNMEFEWQQPKNNKIFDQLAADAKKEKGTFAMTLIQDGNQIESKMVKTGVLDRYIPKEWAEANGTTADKYNGYLALQTLNKVFEYNCVNPASKYTNCWDFVAKDQHGLFMDINSEIVGKNFLYMLTKPEYAADLKAAYDKLDDAKKAYFKPTVDAMAKDAKDLGLDANGKYALAWIKLWVNSYNAVTDDGPICNELVKKSAVNQFGLLVYSKVRSVAESNEVSVKNIKVAAYQPGYEGMGGYAYCHYLFLTDNSPLPWTSCAFIAYMTQTLDGFSAWGKDIGGYSSNPKVAAAVEQKYHHSEGKSSKTVCDTTKDRGLKWWTTNGKLVVEDPKYCASVAFSVGSWIENLKKYQPK